MAQGHSVDEYLETIYFLAFPIGEYHPHGGGPAAASRVAEMLGVSRASVGEMLKRLEADGLIERGARKEAVLTATGREGAERVVRKHRMIERFLTDFMGYTAAESHVHADELGDTFTDDMVERIDVQLGNPERCPHGWPVDTAFEQAENRELTALAELEPGARATIVRLAEHDGELLHWFYDEGLSRAARWSCAPERSAGQFTVRLNGADRAIGEKAAAGLLVPRGVAWRDRASGASSSSTTPLSPRHGAAGARRRRGRRGGSRSSRRSRASGTRTALRRGAARVVPRSAFAGYALPRAARGGSRRRPGSWSAWAS